MRSGTSSSSVECSIAALPTRPPRLRAFASRPRAMRSWRSCRSRITKCSPRRARVVVERAHLYCPPRPAARRQEAVTVGHRRRHDFLYRGRLGQLCPADGERDDAPAVEIENPADRPAEQQIALPVLEIRIPMHRLGKAERSQRRRQHVRQHVDRRFAALVSCDSRGTCPSAYPRDRGCATSILFLRANPTAAGVGAPSAPNAAATGGPVSSSSRSVCRSAIFAMRAVRRRGVL